MELNLAGKTALITGGSKGIGLAVAKVLAEEGCNLHLAARTETDLEAARRGIIESHNVAVTTHATDLSDGDVARQLAADCADIDILVNNAGAIPGGTLGQIDEPIWRAAWDLKVFGYINLCRAVYDAMAARGSGVIVNVIGLAGERPSAGYIAGCTANAGLMAFTRGLGAASVDQGVRVVAVNPGLIATDRMVTLMEKRADNEFGDKTRWREFLTGLPMGRAGEPEEVANVVAFLASDRSSYVSGTVVTVDAGTSSRGGL